MKLAGAPAAAGDILRAVLDRIRLQNFKTHRDTEIKLGRLTVLVGPNYATEKFGKGPRHFDSIDALLNIARNLLADDVVVLIKGSRFMQMERVVQHLEVHDA